MGRWILAAALLAAAPAGAQHRPSTVCRLPVQPPAAAGGPTSAVSLGARGARETCDDPTATFEVTYDGFPDAARRAFSAAVETWACRIVSDIPIRIDARWEPLGAAVLGSAGPFLTRNFEGAPARDTWYPSALADVLAGRDLASGPDIDATFNSAFGTWHLDPDTPPGPDDYDLYTVVLHELGHGLGFIGNLTVEDGLGFVGAPGQTEGAFIYDRFTRDASGAPLLDFGDGTPALADALQDAATFGGPAVEAAAGGAVPLHMPSRWEPGGSYSHLDEQAFGSGTPDGLMTPFVARGEAVEAPGGAVCAVLADLGWSLSGACAASVGPVTPPGDALTLVPLSANPVRDGAIEVGVAAAVPQSASVTLVDVLGRRVASEEVSLSSDARTVRFDARPLASGVYLVVVEAGGQQDALAVTVAR